MADGENREGLVVDDFEQDDVTGRAEGHSELPQCGIITRGTPRPERKIPQGDQGLLNGDDCALCKVRVTLDQEVGEPLQIEIKARRIGEPEAHSECAA